MKKSQNAFKNAKKVIPGGVNSPVRAYKSVGGFPPFIKKAKGAYLYDIDGNKYIDYVLSWGPQILGHCPEGLVKTLNHQVRLGTSFGAPTEQETELAQSIKYFYPSMQKTRLVNSGTEATMSAVRLARAYTKKDIIIKFDGCYHGHGDGFLIKSGSGNLTLGISNTPGVPKNVSKNTLSIPYNDEQALIKAFEKYQNNIAAVIIEPIAGNMGLIEPSKSFLHALNQLRQTEGNLIIFDEVLCGFRVHPKGAQGLLKFKPDLTCLGKVIGGGLPVGAYGGHHEIMDLIAPKGSVYQAGTLSGNPLAVAAGIYTLSQLKNMKTFNASQKAAIKLAQNIQKILQKHKFSFQVHQVGSLFNIFFSEFPVTDLRSAMKCDLKVFNAFFHHMLKNGIYWPASQFETCFTSTTHKDKEINRTTEVMDDFFYNQKKF
jgi:glutamate-1-semialdehyde 2,1-aminomutase